MKKKLFLVTSRVKPFDTESYLVDSEIYAKDKRQARSEARIELTRYFADIGCSNPITLSRKAKIVEVFDWYEIYPEDKPEEPIEPTGMFFA